MGGLLIIVKNNRGSDYPGTPSLETYCFVAIKTKLILILVTFELVTTKNLHPQGHHWC